MLKPAIEYKEALTIKLQENFNLLHLLTAKPEILFNIVNNTNQSYSFVSVDNDNNVIGYFHYFLISINDREYAATNIKIINFTKRYNIFAKDFYNLITQHIFHPLNNCSRLTFSCKQDNPIDAFYSRFISKCGRLLWSKNGYNRYQIYKQDFWAHFKRV